MADEETLNLAMLRDVARRLEPLLPRLAFLGGVVAELFFTEPTARPGRATSDVDMIIDLVNYGQYAEMLREELVALGLEEDTTEGAPRCRWRFIAAPRQIVDIMPTNGEVLGFSTEWYADAFRTAEPFQVPGGPVISRSSSAGPWLPGRRDSPTSRPPTGSSAAGASSSAGHGRSIAATHRASRARAMRVKRQAAAPPRQEVSFLLGHNAVGGHLIDGAVSPRESRS